MESKLEPPLADRSVADRHLADAVPLVPRDGRETQEALSKLAEEAARATAALRPADFPAGPRPSDPAGLPPAPPDFDEGPPPPNGGRGAVSGVLRFAFAAGIGVAATLAWQSYGDAARHLLITHVPALAGPLAIVAAAPDEPGAADDATALSPPPADAPAPGPVLASVPAATALPVTPDLTPQIEAMARDLAALREATSRELAGLREGLARLIAAQDEMTRSLAHSQADDEPMPVPKPRPAAARRPPPPVAAPAAPAVAAAPVARVAPRPAPPPAASAPLSVVPPAGALAEPPRRPPAGLP